MKKNTLLLIDGFNLLSRGYFATAYGRDEEDLTKNIDGTYINALNVFFRKLFQLFRQYDVTHALVAWDVKRNETDRRVKYDFYKATRNELPPPLIEQYETCQKILDALSIKQMSLAPYEADDLIGSLSLSWTVQEEGKCYIYSNDKDLFQLLNEDVAQIVAGKRGDSVFTMDDFQTEYGISPSQWVDVKALLGDKSDNIPGCRGVGEKAALPLIQLYGSIDGLYENVETLDKKFNRYKKKLLEGRETTLVSKELAQILCSIPELQAFDFNTLSLDLNETLVYKEMNKVGIFASF
ncbi:5'-3' exonuclease [Priestia filamentosa]|uniref:5'-3' exonuclease n=1 Tax=Priestia filamentosa TaxID=1402861 RepID=A0A1X7DI95_9BACI|nr:5'-3' exonuclease [Priestia filamentosa]AKO93389.1 5'-3' exonuclease [Priestia filamentosa]MDT3763573.1 5'-3' exonuclease [Priestia filamentosa]OXS71930.1 flap endonuclease [Priestia filamentosa]RJS63310.1 flap endonuclease [Priestia filamentosa]WCM14222.1 5'-3' exonuclease [Priestia filamentosa]